jgi:hypothetical protein
MGFDIFLVDHMFDFPVDADLVTRSVANILFPPYGDSRSQVGVFSKEHISNPPGFIVYPTAN